MAGWQRTLTTRIGEVWGYRTDPTFSPEVHAGVTPKLKTDRPIPEKVATELSNYVPTLPDGQERFFTDRFSPKRWEKVRKALGLPDLKFHDLRKTFAPLLAQRGVSTPVTQRLLEHSSPQHTSDVYTNVDPVLRQAIGQLPVSDWV